LKEINAMEQKKLIVQRVEENTEPNRRAAYETPTVLSYSERDLLEQLGPTVQAGTQLNPGMNTIFGPPQSP
jgi:hypothetical protein